MKQKSSAGITLVALVCSVLLSRGFATTTDWQPVYSQQTRHFDLHYKGSMVISNVSFDVKCSSSEHTTTSATFVEQTREPITDAFGTGTAYVFKFKGANSDSIKQVFYCYEGRPFFLCETFVTNDGNQPSSAYMSPLSGDLSSGSITGSDMRALFVPYDNGTYSAYRSDPLAKPAESFEVSAIFSNESRQGLVIGSIEHETWKSGVNAVTDNAGKTALAAFGGRTNYLDTRAHGSVKAATIKSPRIFAGFYSDWREGMEGYAKANAIVAAPLAWNSGVPFGWNAWGAIASHMQPSHGTEVSDFFASSLQNNSFSNDNTVFIGLDAWWLGHGLVETGLSDFVQHCKANHQKAGIYWNPFTYWVEANGDKIAEGSKYCFNDLYLRANGKIVKNASGGMALDPTHPGTKARNDHFLAMFKRLGFEFLKLDFVSDGAAEADSWFDPQVTTGMQAINQGLKDYLAQANGQFFISFGVAALFPHQYCHSRKIATDVFAYSNETERLMNAVAYGWWLSGLYKNDGDHIVLGAPWWDTRIPSDAENRQRVTSAVITGIYLDGDDFSSSGPSVAKTKAAKFLTNAEINQIAKINRSFRPVEGNTGSSAPSAFFCSTADSAYVAVFNFASKTQTISIDMARLGLNSGQPWRLTELWSGKATSATTAFNLTLEAYDAAVFKVVK